MSTRLPAWLLPVALVLALGAGLIAVVGQRLEEGDLYAPYSTFRADPFGTKALFLSLQELPDRPVSVERSLRPLAKLAKGPDGSELDLTGTTVFLLAEHPSLWAYRPPRFRFEQIETLARQGARVVLAFEPIKKPLVTRPEITFLLDEEDDPDGGKGTPPDGKKAPPKDAKNKKKENPEDQPGKPQLRGVFEIPRSVDDQLNDRWGLSLARTEAKSDAAKAKPGDTVLTADDTAVTTPAVAAFPGETGRDPLPWVSALHFVVKPTDEPLWRIMYQRMRQPVLAERPFGKGSLVVCGDTFFLSNEALYRDRSASALAWLIGKSSRVIFDEYYLGTRENPGLMTLANRYRLSGLAVGFVLLALLYVWKNTSPLVPPPPDPGSAGAPPQAGLGGDAGFPALLRRAVSAPDLPRLAFEQWRHTPAGLDGRTSPTPERVSRLQALIAGDNKNPAAVYRSMRDVLRQRTSPAGTGAAPR